MTDYLIKAGEKRIHRIELDHDKRECRFIAPYYNKDFDDYEVLEHLRSFLPLENGTVTINHDRQEIMCSVQNLQEIIDSIKFMRQHPDYSESINSSLLEDEFFVFSVAERSVNEEIKLEILDDSEFIPFTPIDNDLDLSNLPKKVDSLKIEPFAQINSAVLAFKKIVPLNTQLQLALDEEKCDLEAVSNIIDIGADPNTQAKHNGWTAAHFAAHQKNRELLKLLTEKGADFNIPDKDGLTPLKLALDNKNLDLGIAYDLILNGADPNTQENRFGWTAAHYAAHQNNTKLLKLLAEKGANFNTTGINGRSPFFYVIGKEAFALLTENGADLLLRDKYDNTPLSKLVQNPLFWKKKLLNKEINKNHNANPEIIKELIRLGADIHNEGKRALDLALHFQDKELQQNIIKAHVQKNSYPDYIQTFLIKNPPSKDHQILIELHTFVGTEIVRLTLESRESSFKKGLDDKIQLLTNLQPAISAALAKNSLDKDELKNLVNQVATIAHHRRYRTCNKIAGVLTFGFYSVRANSWNNFQKFVQEQGQEQGKVVDPDVKKILEDSLRVREDKLVCVDSSGIESVGYEEYRRNAL